MTAILSEQLRRSSVQAVLKRFVDTFCSKFQKNGPTGFQKSRKALILGALESYDPGASNGVSNVEIWPNAANLVSFDVSRFTRNLVWNRQKGWQKLTYFCQHGHFKRDEISSKKSDSDGRPTVGCARIYTFQHEWNYCCGTIMRSCSVKCLKTKRKYWILSKMCPQSPKERPEYGLYSCDA